MGLQDHMVVLFLIFGGTSILFSVVAAPTYIPTTSVGGFPFLYILSTIYYYYYFLMNLLIYRSVFGCVGSSLLRVGFLQSRRGGLPLVAVCGLLTAVASPAAEHRL